MSGGGRQRRGFGPTRFRSRIFWSVIPIFVVFLIVIGAVNVDQHRRLVEDEFRKRGEELSANLAYSCELGVLSEDLALLDIAVQKSEADEDVAYASVFTADGRVLAEGGGQIEGPSPLDRSLSAMEVARLEEEMAPFSRGTVDDGRFMEFVAPIVLEELSAADPLLGFGGDGETRRSVVGWVRLGLTLDPLREHLVAIVRTWTLLGGGFLLAAVVAILVFSRRITQPINQLKDQAKQIEAGNLDQTIEVRSRDEIGELASSFNEMAGSLRRNIAEKERVLDELRDLNENLEERIAERTNALREHRDALQRSLEEVRTMATTARSVGSSLDVEEVLATVSRYGADLSGGDACAIVELRGEQEKVSVVASHRLSDEFIQRFEAISPETQRVLERNARRLDVAQVEDLKIVSDAPVRDLLLAEGFRALLRVSLGGDEETVRSMIVLRKDPGAFDDRAISLVTTLASQSKVAIDNARLFADLEQQRKDMAETTDELDAANRHKSQFLANMSHELRTPLNAVIGFSEVLLERMFGEINEKQEDYLTDILASGKHLLSLINDILDLSKIEAGRMELELTRFDVPAALGNAMILVKERALRHQIELSQEVDPELGEIVADERKFKQVLVNLLSNAVKFTPGGGSVTLSARRTGDGLEVAVRDTGIGISPEDQERVFEAFRQAKAGKEGLEKSEGTGLGLSLSRRIVELHGGILSLESTVGKGSTFTFTIPEVVPERASEQGPEAPAAAEGAGS